MLAPSAGGQQIEQQRLLAGAGCAGHGDEAAERERHVDRLNRGNWWLHLFGLGTLAEPTGLVRLFSSHPPMKERIARLRGMRSWAGVVYPMPYWLRGAS